MDIGTPSGYREKYFFQKGGNMPPCRPGDAVINPAVSRLS